MKFVLKIRDSNIVIASGETAEDFTVKQIDKYINRQEIEIAESRTGAKGAEKPEADASKKGEEKGK